MSSIKSTARYFNLDKVITFGEVLLPLSTEKHLRFAQAKSFDVCHGCRGSNVVYGRAHSATVMKETGMVPLFYHTDGTQLISTEILNTKDFEGLKLKESLSIIKEIIRIANYYFIKLIKLHL